MLLPLILIFGGLFGAYLILEPEWQKSKLIQQPAVYYKDYVIDNDGTLVYTNKHIDTTV